jgi:hypothetical protein
MSAFERRLDRLIEDYDAMAAKCGSERQLKKRMSGRRRETGKMKREPTRKRGPSHNWAEKDLRHLAGILQKVWASDRYKKRKLAEDRAFAKMLDLCRPGNARRSNSLLLLDSLVEYSRMDSVNLDRMTRAFETFHRQLPRLRLLPKIR